MCVCACVCLSTKTVMIFGNILFHFFVDLPKDLFKYKKVIQHADVTRTRENINYPNTKRNGKHFVLIILCFVCPLSLLYYESVFEIIKLSNKTLFLGFI